MEWPLTGENLSTEKKPVPVHFLQHKSDVHCPESEPAPLWENPARNRFINELRANIVQWAQALG
jgi:hypothetical protein